MIGTKEIVDLLIEDQESHEAVVRAIHLSRFDFIDWSWGNAKHIAYALGSLRIKLPIDWIDDEKCEVKVNVMAVLLWSEIDKVKFRIKYQFNERFKHSENRTRQA